MHKGQFIGTAAALQATAADQRLSEREKHLIGLAVTATRGCVHCTSGRIKKAIAGGVPEEAVVAAIDLAAAVNAGVTVRTALSAIDQLPSDGACTHAACVGAEDTAAR